MKEIIYVKNVIKKSNEYDNNPLFGKKPWNYGLTKENNNTLKKIGKKRSLQFKNGEIDTSNYGIKTEEGLKNISLSQRGKNKSEYHKQKISNTLKGRKLSKETKIKMSNARKGVPQKK